MQTYRKFTLIFLIAASAAAALHRLNPLDVPASVTKDGSGEGEVPVATAHEWIASRGAVFIDSSLASDFSKGHIAAAVSLPLESFHSGDPESLMELPHGVPLIVYCRLGCDSSQIVAQRLRGAGFEDVFVLGGGFEAWLQAGYPTETGR